LSPVIVLLSIISACVTWGSSVFIIMSVRLLSISVLFPLSFDVCVIPCNVVSTVVFCAGGAPFLGGRLDGASFGLLGDAACFVAVLYSVVQLADVLFFVSLRPPMWVGIVCSVGYLFVGVLGIRGIDARCCYIRSTWGADFRKK
jgi:hypothetical protein